MAKIFTAKQVYDLDHMNAASRRIGGLGTLLFGSVPSAGTLEALRVNHYACAPALGTNTAITAAKALAVGAQPSAVVTITQPDFPRVLLAKGVGANLAGNVVIHGTNFAGTVISDTIALNAANAVSGVLAFKTVTSIDLPAYTNSTSDTVSIGTTASIGLPQIIEATDVLFVHNLNNSNDAGSVTRNATLIEGNFYAVAGSLNGTLVLDLYYLA
jgi:hypothetical protein